MVRLRSLSFMLVAVAAPSGAQVAPLSVLPDEPLPGEASTLDVEPPEPALPGEPAVPDEEDALGLARDVGSLLFFDAQSTSFSRDGQAQVLEGDVVAIGAGVMVGADRILYDRARQRVEAQGRIVMMSRSQVFLGEAMTFELATGNFRIEQATMVANDPDEARAVTERILGFSERELAFERARKERVAEIAIRKERLRVEARRQALAGQELSPDIVDRYATLLDQEELARSQENPALALMHPERREAIKRRRLYWDQSRRLAVQAGRVLPRAHFRLSGESIERTSGNDYVARDSLFTPCRCEEGEAPAWAFRADETHAQIGGYADLSHPVLEIKGVPVLYLPYLKVPIKEERQSGFLMPVFAFERRSGNIYSQPVYFDLGRSRDATLTTDVFERRGTRLGIEYRHQQSQFSGWEIRAEAMRDRLWMEDRSVREDLVGLYRDGLDAVQSGTGGPAPLASGSVRDSHAERLRDPAYWSALYRGTSEEQLARARSDVDRHLDVPSATWRGAYGWRGVTFFAPRLSLVSSGEITSDHRYNEELHVPDDFREAFFGGREAKAHSTAKAQVHLDGRDFYAGLGARYGDNLLTEERFEGQQMPLDLKVQSRRFELTPAGSRIPVTAAVMTEAIRISESREAGSEVATEPTLGEGSWRRAKVDLVAPLLSDTVIQVSQFAELETRQVEHAALDPGKSSMRSWRTGVEFTLPIDGKGELPEALQAGEDCSRFQRTADYEACEARVAAEAGKRRYVHHLMDWRLRFSVRPTVVRDGPYADPEPGGLAYFASDRFVHADAPDEDVPEEERMRQHQRVSLSTNHAWKLFRRSWQLAPGQEPAAPAGPAPTDRRERAREEIMRALQRPLPDEAELSGGVARPWLWDERFELRDEYYESPVSFNAVVAYDFLDAQERERQRERNRDAAEGDRVRLAEPWKDPTARLAVRHAGFAFDAGVRYSVYARTARELDLGLSFPTVFQTSLGVGYYQAKAIDLLENEFTRTRERRLSLSSTLIPTVTSYAAVRSREVDGREFTHKRGVASALGFEYQSPSQCWGLQFSREKEYDRDEREASYVLRLSVVFMGQERPLPNMSPAVTRRLRDDGEVEAGT